MKWFGKSFIRRFLKEQSGQTIAFLGVTIGTMFALAGMSVETGHIYYAYRLLVASTNAATLAGAQTMGNYFLQPTDYPGKTLSQAVSAAVIKYSSQSSQLNANNFLQSASITPTLFCSTVVSNSFNVGCESASGGGSYNALKVVQTASVPLWFGGLVGLRQMNLSATGTAAMKGGTNIPYNLAILIDTTSSMNNTVREKDGSCNNTPQIQCAIQGFTVMLQYMNPCALNTSCPGSNTYVDDVALYVFPAVAAGQAKYDYTCPNKNPGIVPYNFVNVTTGSSQNLGMPTTGTNAGGYQIINFNNAYKQNDATTALLASSELAAAVGYSGTGCKGLQAPGGEGTYYAQAIYQAQAALVAQQIATPNSQNIMIILSDGDAYACNTGANTAAGGENCGTGGASQIVADNCPSINGNGSTPCKSPNSGRPLNGTGTASTNASGYQSATYPSELGQCGQAVQAAQAATAAGTTVYTIAFDAPTSGGCSTDQHYTVSSGSTYGAEAFPGGSYSGQPCNAIGAMASSPSTFYSDDTAGCPAIAANNQSYQSLAQIFKAIAQGLTAPRLIPNGTQ